MHAQLYSMLVIFVGYIIIDKAPLPTVAGASFDTKDDCIGVAAAAKAWLDHPMVNESRKLAFIVGFSWEYN